MIALILVTGCTPEPKLLPVEHDAKMVSEFIREIWSKRNLGNMLFVNVEEKPILPPQLAEMILLPSTTVDYIYVRVWIDRSEGTPNRQFLAHYVVRDKNTGARIRGNLKNGMTSFESLSKLFWNLNI